VNDLFKDLVFDVIAREVIRRLLVMIPLLSFGPIAALATELLMRFARMFYDYQKEVVKFYRFEFINNENQKAFDKEVQSLKAMQEDPNATDIQKKKALEMAKKRMAFLVRYSVSDK